MQEGRGSCLDAGKAIDTRKANAGEVAKRKPPSRFPARFKSAAAVITKQRFGWNSYEACPCDGLENTPAYLTLGAGPAT